MTQDIVVIGAGFAGVWSALSAQSLINQKSGQVNVTVIAPEPTLVIRPRLYEANVSTMTHPLNALFEDAGIKFIRGRVEAIDTDEDTVRVKLTSGSDSSVGYDRLILAAGSSVLRPPKIRGVQEHTFDIDTIQSATRLDSHLKELASLPQTTSRDTVVVCGAGFTGIELATELPKRFPKMRVILVDSANEVGPELGPGPRPTILKALKDLGIVVKLGSAVTSVDNEGVTLSSGERIDTLTAVWTAGMRATTLTQQIGGEKDALGRLKVDQYLCVPSSKKVYATGDAACALADDKDHYALQSCQHALQLGRVSGNNAAADLLGEPMVPYFQPAYVCCLDLGGYGAVFSKGWERTVWLTGGMAKRVKLFINQQLIYPPQDAKEAMAKASPTSSNSDELFSRMVSYVKFEANNIWSAL